MVRLLNVDQMALAYLSASSQDEEDSLWDAFLVLRDHGFITEHAWDCFFDIVYPDWLAEDPTIDP